MNLKKIYIGIGAIVVVIIATLIFFKFKDTSLDKTIEKVKAYDKYTLTCNMEMVELSLLEDSASRKELHDLIERHWKYTGSKLARTLLDNWQQHVDEFIQVTPIEYKRVLAEEQMKKLQQKIAEVQRDY